MFTAFDPVILEKGSAKKMIRYLHIFFSQMVGQCGFIYTSSFWKHPNIKLMIVQPYVQIPHDHKNLDFKGLRDYFSI